MELERILDPECTRADVAVASKKRVLEQASELLAAQHAELEPGQLLEALIARERLGSTAVGEGVALPHCRFSSCSAPVAALLRLEEAVDFEASDRRPVDLVFVLVVPEEANDLHLQILATAATALNDPGYRAALRGAGSDADLHAVAIRPPEVKRAAGHH
ncbi:MAG: PTS fructose transporter subunit IIA [Gammaproteobacteria bacterium]|nr:MAG: PTS fructose transporter subunit IIA [Gammaproteobacteria bacterium]